MSITPVGPSGELPPLSRVWTLWMGLLPVAPPLALLGLLGLGHLRRVPRSLWWILGAFAVTQLVAALLVDQMPALAFSLATARLALTLGLLGLGWILGHQRSLWPLGPGLMVVYLTALVNGFFLQGWDLTQLRLTHPYYTPVSLGLAGAVGVWLAVFSQAGQKGGLIWWRVILGATALLITLLSGSRGPLFVLFIGLVLAFARSRQRPWLPVAGVVLVVAGSMAGLFSGTALQRFGSLDATGRDLVWADALSVAEASPLGGVGPYLLGSRIAPPGQPCVWFEALEVRGVSCPPLAEQLNNVWLIAHNGAVQQLAEAGLIGTAGLFLLLGALALAAWQSRSPFVIAVVLGLLAANLTDNVTLLPGPGFAELFWVLGGWALWHTHLDGMPGRAALWGAVLLMLTSFPLWAKLIPAPPVTVGLTGMVRPSTWRADEPYAAAAQLVLPAGTYRAQLRVCQRTCVNVSVRALTAQPGTGTWQWLFGPLPSPGRLGSGYSRTYTMQYRVWPGISPPWRVRPLAEARWTTQVTE